MTTEARLVSTGTVATQAATGTQVQARRSRLHYLDHFRGALAVLVVLHHVAMVYGASVPTFYYIEPPFTNPLAFVTLLVFALVNQSWFMGAFFLLAGYFAPGSLDRQGVGAFLKGKLLRLGIPLILFVFVLNPLSSLGYYLMPVELTGITNPPSWAAYPQFIGLGPLWFVLMLLIFYIGYVLLRVLRRNSAPVSTGSSSALDTAGVAVFIVSLAAANYLFRMLIPIGKFVLGFPSLAYLPQYLSFFVVGAIAYRRNWLRTLPNSLGWTGLVVAVVAAIVFFPLGFSGKLFSLALSPALDNAMGNGHLQSAAYALWDAAFAVGICLALLTFFRRFGDRQGGFGRFMARQSYAVYLLHIPIVVFTAYALRNVALAPLPKFALASVIVTPICFIVAYVVRKLPFVSKVL